MRLPDAQRDTYPTGASGRPDPAPENRRNRTHTTVCHNDCNDGGCPVPFVPQTPKNVRPDPRVTSPVSVRFRVQVLGTHRGVRAETLGETPLVGT